MGTYSCVPQAARYLIGVQELGLTKAVDMVRCHPQLRGITVMFLEWCLVNTALSRELPSVIPEAEYCLLDDPTQFAEDIVSELMKPEAMN